MCEGEFTFLHNMSTGRVIADPANYYEKMADRAYGANCLAYLGLSSEVVGYQVKSLNAVKSIIAGGANTEKGVCVSPTTMNK